MSQTPEERMLEIEALMGEAGFWQDKNKAQQIVQEYTALKEGGDEGASYDNAPIALSIIAGAGGDDAEDWAAILFTMYRKYAERKGYAYSVIHEHKNTIGGYRNVTLEIKGKGVYKNLKHESGVHRLVRLSPFNAKQLRHTSFALVDVVPQLPPTPAIELTDADVDVQFTNSGGPGGQNVNKRHTAVYMVHKKTGLQVRVESERSQSDNKQRAFEILRGKLFMLMEKEHKQKVSELSATSGRDIEWGNQVRNYVLHPYKLVKETRVEYEEHNPERVFAGEIDGFVDALSALG